MPFGMIGGIVSGLGALGGAFMQSNAASDAARMQSKTANKALDYQAMAYLDIANKLTPFLEGGTDAFRQLLLWMGVGPGGELIPSALSTDPRQLAGIGAPPTPPNPNDPALRNAFIASPGFAHQMEQMGNAVQNSAAARTGMFSGNMMRDLQRNAQGLASGDWWNNYNQVVNNYTNQYGNWLNQYNLARTQRNDILNYLSGISGMGQSAAVQQGGFGQQAVNNASSLLNLIGGSQAAGTVGSANAWSNLFNSPSFQNSVNSMLPFLSGSSGGVPNTLTGDWLDAGRDLAFGW